MANETKTVRVMFKSDEGKSFTVSVASVNPALEEAGGDVIAQNAIDALMNEQPFKHTIAECTGVEVVTRSVNKIL